MALYRAIGFKSCQTSPGTSPHFYVHRRAQGFLSDDAAFFRNVPRDSSIYRVRVVKIALTRSFCNSSGMECWKYPRAQGLARFRSAWGHRNIVAGAAFWKNGWISNVCRKRSGHWVWRELDPLSKKCGVGGRSEWRDLTPMARYNATNCTKILHVRLTDTRGNVIPLHGLHKQTKHKTT